MLHPVSCVWLSPIFIDIISHQSELGQAVWAGLMKSDINWISNTFFVAPAPRQPSQHWAGCYRNGENFCWVQSRNDSPFSTQECSLVYCVIYSSLWNGSEYEQVYWKSLHLIDYLICWTIRTGWVKTIQGQPYIFIMRVVAPPYLHPLSTSLEFLGRFSRLL